MEPRQCDRRHESGARQGPDALTRRHIYQTGIGPVCMSECEYAAYLDAKEERERDDDED